MPFDYNNALVKRSRELRKNMTPEERHLWYDFLKYLPLTVHRQKIINHYIVDFYIHSAKIVIELDGIQHDSRENTSYDKIRDSELNSLGITVLRYPNSLVRDDFSYVCQNILDHLELQYKDLVR